MRDSWGRNCLEKKTRRKTRLGADQHYEVAISFLREITRDTSKFPLVLAENINYGFRRNLWGLKAYGLVIAILAAIASWGFFLSSAGFPWVESWVDNVIANADGITTTRLIGSICNTSAIVIWFLVITPKWVRNTAEAYAECLLGAIDTFT